VETSTGQFMNHSWNLLAAPLPPDAGCSLPLIPVSRRFLHPLRQWLEGCRLTGLASLVLAAGCLLGPVARAGFTLEMDVVRANPYGYSFGPNLMTNAATSNSPYGDYQITSYGFPTNGAVAIYHFDTNGLAWLGSRYWGYNDYDTLIHDLTYGPWSITLTNATLTNAYHFNVTVNMISNEVPYLEMIYPTNGEVAVPLQPTLIWSGPTNYNGLVIYSGAESADLPVTQTEWSEWTFSPGTNNFTVHYDLYDTNSLVSSIPTDGGGDSLAGWSSTAHLQDYAVVQFTAVSAPPPVTLSGLTNAGGTLQFSFLSQSALMHEVQYRTNLVTGTAWQSYSNVAGDGTLKTIPVPLPLFSPARQGFIRVSTQ
jgi:hypothetical protein